MVTHENCFLFVLDIGEGPPEEDEEGADEDEDEDEQEDEAGDGKEGHREGQEQNIQLVSISISTWASRVWSIATLHHKTTKKSPDMDF